MAIKKAKAKKPAKAKVPRKKVNKTAVNAIVRPVVPETVKKPEGPFTVSGVMRRTNEYAKKYAKDLSLYYLAPMFLGFLVMIPLIIAMETKAGFFGRHPVMAEMLSNMVSYPLMMFAMLGMIMVYIKIAKQESNEMPAKGEFGFLLVEMLKRLPLLIMLYIVLLLVMIPLIIPALIAAAFKQFMGAAVWFGIYFILISWLMLVYGQAFLIAIVKPGIYNAFKESADLTRNRRFKIFLSYSVLFAVIIAVELVMLAAIFIPVFLFKENLYMLIPFGMVALVALFALSLYAAVFYYAQYKELKETEG